jgi:hypothetical protein
VPFCSPFYHKAAANTNKKVTQSFIKNIMFIGDDYETTMQKSQQYHKNGYGIWVRYAYCGFAAL